MNQIDLDTLEVGGTPSLWLFVDEYNVEGKAHKNGELWRVEGFSMAQSNDGEKEFVVAELTKIMKDGVNECYKLSAWALKSKEKIKAKELQGKYIFLEKNGTRLLFKVATQTEVEQYKAMLQGQKQEVLVDIEENVQ